MLQADYTEKPMRFLIPFIFALSYTASTNAADLFNGEELHSEKCTACHDSSMYTRDNSRVQSLPALATQVRFCKDNLGIAWFDDEVEDVIAYLNENHYHF